MLWNPIERGIIWTKPNQNWTTSTIEHPGSTSMSIRDQMYNCALWSCDSQYSWCNSKTKIQMIQWFQQRQSYSQRSGFNKVKQTITGLIKNYEERHKNVDALQFLHFLSQFRHIKWTKSQELIQKSDYFTKKKK